MDKPIPADIEGLKNYIGGVVLDLYQARGIANAAAARLAELEKEITELKTKAEKQEAS